VTLPARAANKAGGCATIRVVRIRTIRGVSLVAAAIVVGGCSGGEEPQPKQAFTAADATRIASVRPEMPGWTWPEHREPPEQRGSQKAETDYLTAQLKRHLADVVDLGQAANKWRDDYKLANLAVGVLGSVSDARKTMAAANDFSRGWGKVGGSRITKDEKVDGLDDEAWRLWVDGNGKQVTYHWRRGNLFVEAHVHCFGSCPSDIDAGTRAWVDAIDKAAREGS
jgi:hypothetical protein